MQLGRHFHSCLINRGCCQKRLLHGHIIRFKVRSGETCVRVSKTEGQGLLEKVNNACFLRCCKRCCRRRVRVRSLQAIVHGMGHPRPHAGSSDHVQSQGSSATVPVARPLQRQYSTDTRSQGPASYEYRHTLGREVNRLVKDWKYWIEAADPSSATYVAATNNEILLDFFLDQDMHYPVLAKPNPEAPNMEGELEVDSTHMVSETIAVILAFSVVVGSIFMVVWFVSHGIQAISANADSYATGGSELIAEINKYAKNVLPAEFLGEITAKMNDFLHQKIPSLASSLLALTQGVAFQTLLFLLYLMFWLSEPLPTNPAVSAMFQKYLLQKSIVCLIFAGSVSLLLRILQCRLWNILFLVTFLMNYIPEVGPILCFVLFLPLLMLDGHLEIHRRLWNTVWFTIIYLILKFVTGNVIELQLYAKSGGDLMRMHPVIMLALMMLFGELLGITGMFMTVPFMAAVKYYMLGANMPPQLLDPMLVIIEGSEHGPHMNFVEQLRRDEMMEADLVSSHSGEDERDCEDEETSPLTNLELTNQVSDESDSAGP